jgi:hypothetical protein
LQSFASTSGVMKNASTAGSAWIRRDEWAVVLVLVFFAVYYAPGLWLGRLRSAEDLGVFYSFESELYRMVHQGPLSWWDELPGLGLSRLANPQMGYLAPLSILFYLVPTLRAMSLYPFLFMSGLTLGTYGWLREERCTPVAALFGAISWATSGLVLFHVQQVAILATFFWLPFALWSASRLSRTGRAWPACMMALSVFGVACSGHPQYMVYELFTLGLWVVTRPGRRRGCVVMLAGLLLAAPQLLPALEYSHYTERTLLRGFDFSNVGHLTVPVALEALVSETSVFTGPIYGSNGFGAEEKADKVLAFPPEVSGVVTLLALWACYRRLADRKTLWLVLFCWLATLGRLGGVVPLLSKLIPNFSEMRLPSRWWVILALVLSALAARAVDHLDRKGSRRWALLALGWALLLPCWVHHSEEHYLDPGSLDVPAAFSTIAGRAVSDYTSVAPQYVNWGLTAGVPYLVAYNPIIPADLFEGLFASQIGSLGQWKDKLHLAVQLGNMIPIVRPDLPLMRAFNLNSRLRRDPVRGVYFVEAHHGLGRFFCVRRFRLAPAPADRWREAHSSDWDPSREAVVSSLPARTSGGPGVETVRVLQDSPDRQGLLVNGPGGLLITSAQFYPGWQVRVDALPTESVKADLALRAVVVPSGEHRVDWIYRPTWLDLACVCVLAGLGLLLAAVLVRGSTANGTQTQDLHHLNRSERILNG